MLKIKRYVQFIFMLAIVLIVGSICSSSAKAYQYPFQDPSLSFDQRVSDLVSRLTLPEEISQLGDNAPAIPRLGINAYEYWNEALHGLASSGVGVNPGVATSFPQAIALSSTWDPNLIYNTASAISDEARVKNNTLGKGLTYFSPVVNMARDPRWGRSEENYGEDPYLASNIAVNFIKGMQGSDPRYLKTVATAKHFAANNVEINRYGISSDVDARSLREYYLPVFKSTVTNGKVYSIMSAYNAVNGVPSPANSTLLTDILRNDWGFQGYVISDCDAVANVYDNHFYASSYQQAAALSMKAGTDLDCMTTYQNYANTAINSGLITKADIDNALTRVFKARFLLGEFDPPSMVPYTSIPASTVDSQANRDLALQAAMKSIVLLKNQNSILPLNKSAINSVAVIGPNANQVQLGAYSGTPSVSISPLQGIQNALVGKTVSYAQGSTITGAKDQTLFDNAVNLARSSDVAIVVVGTDGTVSGEGFDRTSLDLPGVQEQLIQAVYQANPRTIVVLVNGVSLGINWTQNNVPGIIEAWYDGQSQGTAIANVLFGDYNPGGKLTTTWYQSVSDLPAMNDYNIRNNRTYMYFQGTPLYSFGYGLSYTTFQYSNLRVSSSTIAAGGAVTVSVDVKNTGSITGDEVAQFYINAVSPRVQRPKKELKGFQRITLTPGQTQTVNFTLIYNDLAYWDVDSNSFVVDGGTINLMAGSSSSDIRLSSQLIASATAPIGRTIWLKANANNQYVSAWFYDSSNSLQARAGYVGDGEKFQVVDAGNGYIALKSNSNGLYVTANNGASSTPLIAGWAASIGDWEKFTWTDQGGGNIALLAKVNGLFVTANNSATNVPLIAGWATSAGVWEKFTWGEAVPMVNLVQNPGFENGLTSWSSSGNWSTTTTPIITGSYSAKLAGASNWQSLTQDINVSPYTYYTWNVYGQNSDNNVFMKVLDPGWGTIAEQQLTQSGSLTRYSLQFYSGANSTIKLYLGGYTGTYYFDDNEILLSGVVDGSFEKGSSAWVNSNGTGSYDFSINTDASNAYIGSKSLHYQFDGIAWDTNFIQNSIGVQPYTNYTVKFWAKGSGQIYAQVLTPDWVTSLGSGSPTVNSTWTQYTFTFNSGSHSQVLLRFSDAYTGNLYIDDVKMVGN